MPDPAAAAALLAALVPEVADLARHTEVAFDSASLEAALRTDGQRPFTLAVVGEIKKGKSSLINVLLGAPTLLPVADEVATSVALFLVHGPQLAMTVHFYPIDDITPQPLPIPPAQLADFATESGNPANGKGVDFVRVQVPAPILQGGLVLVDTPGLGGMHRNHAVVTWRHLPAADAVLLVTDSVESLLSRRERDFVRQLASMGKYLFFAQTKADAASSEQRTQFRDRNLQILAQTLDKAADELTYFLVSASLAKKALLTPALRAKLWPNSGLEGLAQFMTDQLLGGQRQRTLLRAASDLTAATKQAERTCKARAASAEKVATADLASARAELQAEVAALTRWTEEAAKPAHAAYAQAMAAARSEARDALTQALGPNGDGLIKVELTNGLTAALADPATAQARCGALLDRARECAAAMVVHVGETARGRATQALVAALHTCGQGEAVADRVAMPAPTAVARMTTAEIALADPNVGRLDHALSALGIAGTVAAMVGSALPGVGWVAGGAAALWMAQRRRHAAVLQQVSVLRQQMLGLLQQELAAALQGGLTSLDTQLIACAERGKAALEALAQERRAPAESRKLWLEVHGKAGAAQAQQAAEAARQLAAQGAELRARIEAARTLAAG